MREYGIIKIRRKIEQDTLLEGIVNFSKEFDNKYPCSVRKRERDGKYVPVSLITEDGYIVDNFKRVYLGKRLCIAICKNSKGRISLLVILERDVEEGVLNKVVSGLKEITGGKFHKA